MRTKKTLALVVFLVCLSGCGKLEDNQDYKNLIAASQILSDSIEIAQILNKVASNPSPSARLSVEDILTVTDNETALLRNIKVLSIALEGTDNEDLTGMLLAMVEPLGGYSVAILDLGTTITGRQGGLYYTKKYFSALKDAADVIDGRIKQMRKDYGE